MAPNEKVSSHEKVGSRYTPGRSQVFDGGSPLFDEHLIERGSMYDRCPLMDVA